MPARIERSAARVTSIAVGGDDPGVRRGPLGDHAVVVDQPGLEGAGLHRPLLRQHVRQQRHRLDVGSPPPLIGRRDHADAAPRGREVERRQRSRGHHQHRLRLRRKRMVARRDAAGDLQIERAEIADAVAADHFAHHQPQAPPGSSASGCAARPATGRAGQGAGSSSMQPAAEHRDHFVDAVSELVAAILDATHRRRRCGR